MTHKNLRQFAYVNDGVCERPVRGIVLRFAGRDSTAMYSVDPPEGEFYGERGFLFVVPYTAPWSWMNRQAAAYTDEVLDVLYEKYAPEGTLPIAATGGSMGGLGAIVYGCFAKRTPAVSVASCPICDMVYHFGSRDDLPRTIYNAVWNGEGSLEDALKSVSPLHLIGKLPRIPYHILHCDADEKVDLRRHSEVFAEAMGKAGYSVTLDVIRGRGHCDLGYFGKKRFAEYILRGLLTAQE